MRWILQLTFDIHVDEVLTNVTYNYLEQKNHANGRSEKTNIEN
jgi:hypothetical protein